MEHNIEKNIRLKVHQAEQYPVRWEKDELWARMEIHRTTRSKRPVYFSIAASLTIALLAGVYTYQRLTDIPGQTEASVKTKLAKPAITNTLHSVNDAMPTTVDAAPRSAIVQNTARIRIEEESYIATPALQVVPYDTIAMQEAIPEANTSPVIPEGVPAEVTKENTDKRPKVIIGIIPPQEQRLVTQQEKKKIFRLRKGRSQDGVADENQLISARLN